MDKGDLVNHLEQTGHPQVQAGGGIILTLLLLFFGYDTFAILMGQYALLNLLLHALNEQTREIQAGFTPSMGKGKQHGNGLEKAAEDEQMQQLGFQAMKKMQEEDMTPQELTDDEEKMQEIMNEVEKK